MVPSASADDTATGKACSPNAAECRAHVTGAEGMLPTTSLGNVHIAELPLPADENHVADPVSATHFVGVGAYLLRVQANACTTALTRPVTLAGV